MATQRSHAPSKQIKHEDFVQFLNIFAPEFNNDSLHDRVLVFEVIQELDEESKIETSVRSGDLRDSEEESETESFCHGSTSDEEEEDVEKATANKDIECTNHEDKVDLKKVNGIDSEDEKESVGLSLATNEKEEKECEEEGYEKNEIVKAAPNDNEREANNDVETKNTKTTKLFVHSSWLAVHSSYFKALFFSGMKESRLKEVVMKVKQSELQAHLTLIEAIYKLDVLNDKDCILVADVLMLADKYDVNIVFKKCKYVLISSSTTLKNCEYIMKIVSSIRDCTDVLDVMEEFLVKEFNPLDKSWLLLRFLTLSKASLKLLLGSDKLVVESENTVFVALMKWIDTHLDEEIWDGRSLLSLVRFELMTLDFMHDVVRRDPLATRLDGFNELLQNGLAYHAFSPARLLELMDKPVSRCAYHRNNLDPTFTWVIAEDEQKMLIDGRAIQSSSFWLKGYQMNLRLVYIALPIKRYSFFLCVQNIVEGAHVEVIWRAKSNLFAIPVICNKSIYKRPKGYGFGMLTSMIAPSKGPNTSPQTIDVWVNIF